MSIQTRKQELKTAQYVLKNALKKAQQGTSYQENLLKLLVEKKFEAIVDAATILAGQASQAMVQAKQLLAQLKTPTGKTLGLSLPACWSMSGSIAALQAHADELQTKLLQPAADDLGQLVREQAKQQPLVERVNRTQDIVHNLEVEIAKIEHSATLSA